ncbi:MAG: rod shape-determining protein MreC [Bacteroidales bacterium]|nr:rod shape-determining protein MreC [Bacteroidales bacterium]
MRSLLNFLLRIHFLLLFILIEIFSIALLVNNNNFHRAKFVNITREFAGNFYSKINNLKKYMTLSEENDRLAKENTRLLNILESTYKSDELFFRSINDTILNQRYRYTSARIVNNSIDRKHNFLTLNKGRLQGLKPEMAVVANESIVGIVKGVSDNYSTVISLLNTDLKVSAKIKKNGYYGSLGWDGRKYTFAILKDIPLHVNIQKGDTIITSGYSSIYPEGILIGYIDDFHEKSGSFYEIKVKLSTNFKNLSHVNVIGNLMQNEILTLEEETQNND